MTQFESSYGRARELCEITPYRLFIKNAEFNAKTDAECVWLKPFETIQDDGWVGDVGGPYEPERLDISAERRKVG